MIASSIHSWVKRKRLHEEYVRRLAPIVYENQKRVFKWLFISYAILSVVDSWLTLVGMRIGFAREINPFLSLFGELGPLMKVAILPVYYWGFKKLHRFDPQSTNLALFFGNFVELFIVGWGLALFHVHSVIG